MSRILSFVLLLGMSAASMAASSIVNCETITADKLVTIPSGTQNVSVYVNPQADADGVRVCATLDRTPTTTNCVNWTPTGAVNGVVTTAASSFWVAPITGIYVSDVESATILCVVVN